jgi:hypothetical protein
MSYFEKQHSSRILKNQQLFWTGSGTALSTNFGPQTFQIRVLSQVAGAFTVSDSTGTTAASSTSMLISANAPIGEYFSVTPGSQCSFASSSTSSGSISVTEMC